MTVLGALARRTDTERAMQATGWGVWPGEGGGTYTGSNVDVSSSLQLLTVYGCVRLIADSIATLPIDVYRRLADGEREPVSTPGWLEQPSEYLNRTAWLTQVVTSLLLDGNAYCFIIRDGSTGSIRELLPLDPKVVRVDKQPGQPKRYLVAGRPYSNFEVLHIPGVMFPGSNVGLSPVEAARQSVGLGMAAQEHGARFFGQGLSLSGVIEVPNELPPTKATEMANLWARKHSGRRNAHLPGVLEGGAHWVPTSITNEQAQFLETRRYTAAEIAGQMFLVDPSELGIGVEGTSLTYANLEQRKHRLASTTLQPWIVRLETAISALLAQPRFMKFNMNAFLRADLQTRYAAHAVGITNKFLLRSEVRQIEDLPPIPGIDDEPTGGTDAPS